MSKFIISSARFFSALFSPLLCGTYAVMAAMLLSFLLYSPANARMIVLLVTFLATCILPLLVIFVMWKTGKIHDPGLNDRRERVVPYTVTIAAYVGVAVYTALVNAPIWLSMMLVGGAVSLTVLASVNSVWKVSGHATGVGGLCAVVLFMLLAGVGVRDLTIEFLAAVLVAGVVCTSRLVLERHTLLQVAAGFANGFFCTILFPLLWK